MMVPLWAAIGCWFTALIGGGWVGWNLCKADNTFEQIKAADLMVICPDCEQISSLGRFEVVQ